MENDLVTLDDLESINKEIGQDEYILNSLDWRAFVEEYDQWANQFKFPAEEQ